MEAVSLLAYDVVWLCRTQGIPVADSLDDFASIGRNMYNLLINSSMQRNQQQRHQQQSQHSLEPSDTTVGGSGSDNPEQQQAADLTRTAPRMGLYSHGTLHTSLATAAGNKLTRSFAMVNPVKLADQLKAKLAHEMHPTAEWELIHNEEDGASLGEDALEDAVMVGGSPPHSRQLASSRGGDRGGARYGLESFMSVNPAGASVAPPREKSHGWTKIKARTPGS